MQKPAPIAPQQPQQPQQPQAQLLVPTSAVPQTASEVRATRIKIDALREQLQDFAERRNSVAGQLLRADLDARPGYQGRLANLDANINELQNQITQATLALSNAPAQALVGASSEQAFPFSRGIPPEATRIVSILASVMVFAIVVGLVRTIISRPWRRERAIADPDTSNQLRQLQQSVDTIAIEVERISEGQRFMTKTLAARDAYVPASQIGPNSS